MKDFMNLSNKDASTVVFLQKWYVNVLCGGFPCMIGSKNNSINHILHFKKTFCLQYKYSILI